MKTKCLTKEQVFQAIEDGRNLQCLIAIRCTNGTREGWGTLSNAALRKSAYEFLTSRKFREVPKYMNYYGAQIPKPLESPFPDYVLFGCSVNNREVYPAGIRRKGELYWDNPEDAQAALTVMLKPFGIEPKPISDSIWRHYNAR